RFGATRIGRGVKLDNLVHVAHNVVLGEATLLCAQVGIAGSSTLGKRVIMGGQAGAGGHLTIADGVSIGGGGGVIGDIAESGEYLGWPARPRRETFKRLAAQNKVPDLMKRLRSLEERLRKLEGESS
ncbi:MAG: UDP-3-O-(3-hydroxymyristoyl)glucosamine N-acyltransferase, partial [Planctomycetota bacterium]